VTPLRAWQILWGRLRGLWMQFLPALLTLLVACYYASGMHGHAFYNVAAFSGEVVVTFLVLPVFGLYFSLFRWNVLTAWLCTCTCGLLLPVLNRLPIAPRAQPWDELGGLLVFQVALAAVFWRMTIDRLANRRYAFA
jgi:hypothetical protein